MIERRSTLLPNQVTLIEQRATPALYIVDGRMRVLYFRPDTSERRKELQPTPEGALPPALEYAALKLIAEHDRKGGTIRRLAVAGSVVVRVLALSGTGPAEYAIIVERFALRDHMKALAERNGLSRREREVLSLVAKGLRNEEIARHLVVSKSTVIFHVKQLLMKTNSRNRTELVAKIIG
jgi:DNA-binding CsgD family transcriptional regulator